MKAATTSKVWSKEECAKRLLVLDPENWGEGKISEMSEEDAEKRRMQKIPSVPPKACEGGVQLGGEIFCI